MSQLVEELVKSGQHNILMSNGLLRWESTTTVGIQMAILECGMESGLLESGATPLIQISDGNPALFHIVMQHTTVRKVSRSVSVILAS